MVSNLAFTSGGVRSLQSLMKVAWLQTSIQKGVIYIYIYIYIYMHPCMGDTCAADEFTLSHILGKHTVGSKKECNVR